MMTTEDVIMVIDKPHLIVKLHRKLLQVDFKKGMRKELEDVLESKPKLRGTLGLLFQTAIPLDVALKDIESVKVDKQGQVKLAIPHRKDIVIPLEPKESRTLVAKLNPLIAAEKKAAAQDIVMVLNKPHFTVRLRETTLEVDLKEGIKKELEDIFEAKPALRENIGFLFQTIIPLDVALRDIESASLDEKEHVKIAVPARKDIVIPLKPDESKRLIGKMNEMMSIEKAKAAREMQVDQETRRALEQKFAQAKEIQQRERSSHY